MQSCSKSAQHVSPSRLSHNQGRFCPYLETTTHAGGRRVTNGPRLHRRRALPLIFIAFQCSRWRQVRDEIE